MVNFIYVWLKLFSKCDVDLPNYLSQFMFAALSQQVSGHQPEVNVQLETSRGRRFVVQSRLPRIALLRNSGRRFGSVIHDHDWSMIMIDPWSWLIHDHDRSMIMIDPWSWLIHDHDWSMIIIDPWSWLIHDHNWSMIMIDLWLIDWHLLHFTQTT
jgi:hypothetical protein